jgi:transcriptional regulator with XRE-family HTH domain
MMDPAQLRAARGLVGWSQRDLAERSGMDINTVKNFEQGRSNPGRSTLIAWRNAFAAAGVMFLDDDEGYGAGVRFRKSRKS